MRILLTPAARQQLRLREKAIRQRANVRKLCAELAIFAALGEVHNALDVAEDAAESQVAARELDEGGALCPS